MAEKISINIDLSRSRQVNHHNESSTHDKLLEQKINKNTVEYKYRYDRIFVLIIFIPIFILSIYLIFSDSEEIVPLSTEAEKPATKQRHLLVPEKLLTKPVRHSVFLYYETINLLDTFNFPIHQRRTSEQSQKAPEAEIQKKKMISESIAQDPDSSRLQKVKPTAKKEENDKTNPVSASHEFIKINSSKLSRVILAENIYQKEPLGLLSNKVTGVKKSAKKVYLFTEINKSKGQSIEHQWWYQGNLISAKKFTILGDRWRCYSSKNLDQLQQGEWLTKVINANGEILASVNFNYLVN